jgi:hypothetical protein
MITYPPANDIGDGLDSDSGSDDEDPQEEAENEYPLADVEAFSR